MHIVVVTFFEGDSTDGVVDQEFIGGFDTTEEAHAWANTFEEWFGNLNGERQIANILITSLSRPVIGLMV
jgi:hypothetical protein